MGNRAGICGGTTAQHCVDECARLQFEFDGKSRDADDQDCDPAGAVFPDTLQGLSQLDYEALRFAGTTNLSALRWLLFMGTNPKARDRNGTTLLHAACRSGSCSIVQELLKRGLNLDAVDSAGWTPLHIAAVMGRRDISLLLLQARASVTYRNKRGKTAAGVCSDPGTSELLREFTASSGDSARGHAPSAGNVVVALAGAPGSVDDSIPTCEPFFVPRQPLFYDDTHREELLYLGLELFSKSAGHGLAFFVASGIVHDHPTDMSNFLMRHAVNAEQLASFLGEDFSLAQTLRLAYIHSVDLTGTGVVSALMKAFRMLRAPSDLQKIDRLVSGIAHLWWRTHDILDDIGVEQEGFDWKSVMEDSANRMGDKTPWEAQGIQLRRAVQSYEGLRRLMFSTIMLCWNLHADPQAMPGGTQQRKMALSSWLEINSHLEGDGSNLPANVQHSIYEKVANTRCDSLLPRPELIAGSRERGSEKSFSEDAEFYNQALAQQDDALVVRGWASIPQGGLERQEMLLQTSTRPMVSRCVLSEATGLDGIAGPEDECEAVWLSLRFYLTLFLSTSPKETPYAFVRMQEAVLREVRRNELQLVLTGRLRRNPAAQDSAAAAEGPPATKLLSGVPFETGENARLPLQLCFLLADGRFQPYEALWLELQFQSLVELEAWESALTVACETPGAGPARPASSANRPPKAHRPQPKPQIDYDCEEDETPRGEIGPGAMLRGRAAKPNGSKPSSFFSDTSAPASPDNPRPMPASAAKDPPSGPRTSKGLLCSPRDASRAESVQSANSVGGEPSIQEMPLPATSMSAGGRLANLMPRNSSRGDDARAPPLTKGPRPAG
eukprot:TRINITY_DN71638_c0_g1_i1.p1 TRINITY_DN71638_c0_g1~~TRINITY_DN71638_c0_g1_i1.p1  ORF type:complete len:838 (-),score=165.09 TRINITY_DN71638_c0_g1_i1:64-2577(-)